MTDTLGSSSSSTNHDNRYPTATSTRPLSHSSSSSNRFSTGHLSINVPDNDRFLPKRRAYGHEEQEEEEGDGEGCPPRSWKGKGKERAVDSEDERGTNGNNEQRQGEWIDVESVRGNIVTPTRRRRNPTINDDEDDDELEFQTPELDPPRTPITLPSSPSHGPTILAHPVRSRLISAGTSSSSYRDSIPASIAYSDDSGLGILGFHEGTDRRTSSRLMQIRSIEEIRADEIREEERNEESSRWKEEQRRIAARALDGTRPDDTTVAPSESSLPEETTFPSLVVEETSPVLPFLDTSGPFPTRSDPSESSATTTDTHDEGSTSHSLPPSNETVDSSSNSSLSLPSSPPVDLTLPNRDTGPYMSVASGPLAQLSATHLADARPQQSRGARGFFSNLLNRSPRSNNVSPRFPSGPTLPNPSQLSPNPSTNTPRSPALDSVRSVSEPHHNRSSSLPTSPVATSNPSSIRREENVPSAPRLSRTFAGLGRSVSLRTSPNRTSPSPPSPNPSNLSGERTGRPLSSAPPPHFPRSAPVSPSPARTSKTELTTIVPATLASIGLSLVSLTPSMSTSRNSQPLCGAILDDKYLLIGTTTGLDFLPLPLPGSLPLPQLGTKRRKQVRKPISLIKRTRFKEIAVLSERSNILLAIAGRNDHIRVYALDGLRALIEKKMTELDIRDGYPFIQDGTIFKAATTPTAVKGKGRAVNPAPSPASSTSALAPPPAHSRPQSTFPRQTTEPYRFPLTSPPPDYSLVSSSSHPSAAQVRRRPSSIRLSTSSSLGPASPTSRTSYPSSRNNSIGTPGSLVRSVPTNPRGSVSSQMTAVPSPTTPRSAIRRQPSKDFVASRKGSSATIVQRRKSRIEVGGSTGFGHGGNFATTTSSSASRSIASSRRSSIAGIEGFAGARSRSRSTPNARHSRRTEDAEDLGRRSSVPFDSLQAVSTEGNGWVTDESPGGSPIKKLEARPLQRSNTADLADFLRESGPEDVSGGHRDGRIETNEDSSSTHPQLVNPFGGEARQPREPLPLSPTVAPSRRSSQPARLQARPGASKALTANERSPILDLADMIRETGPSDPRPTPSSLPHSRSLPNGSIASRASVDSGRSPQRNTFSRQMVPPTNSQPRRRSNSVRLVARSPFATPTVDSSDEAPDGSPADNRKTGQSLIDAINAGPPPSSTGLGISALSSTTDPDRSTARTSRVAKRWTMSGMSSLLQRSAPGDGGSEVLSGSAARANARSRASVETRRSSDQWENVSPEPPSTSTSTTTATVTEEPPHMDGKMRPRPSLQPDEAPSIPQSSQLPPDAHPANNTSPLEYVKLARTRGARLLRAVETKKRTYLAVLCGEEGERIELFTGSRNISLSLNRTFVLPETPRTIDFQLQGDDLVDIYLIYRESIFALEPATVRVREVGVGRSDRRARRERERAMQDVGAGASTTVQDGEEGPPLTAGMPTNDHQASPLVEERRRSEVHAGGEDTTIAAGEPRTPSPSTRPVSTEHSPIPSPSPNTLSAPAYSATVETVTTSRPIRPSETPPRPRTTSQAKKSVAPYSTFSQLPFIPPVPSSVLSSAWTIPPLYTDVVAGSPMPSNEGFENPSITLSSEPDPFTAPSPHVDAQADLPLLSPVSLLGGAALRSNGPPGLFFVSRGSHLSGIVTADGKSIIKRPLVWTNEKPTNPEALDDMPHHVQVLIVGSSKTVVVRISPTDVKAISVEGTSPSNPFSTPVSVFPSYPPRPSIQFLATHSASQQLFFAQTIGQTWTVQCLAAKT